MHRFFVNPDNIKGETIILSGDDVKHIVNVLRLGKGDKLILCDGESNDYIAQICCIENNNIRVSILEKKKCGAEPNVRINLFQALPKSDKLEFIIQKAVEIGVCGIFPVFSERVVAKPIRFDKKLLRFKKIAESAAKQSGRGIIPEINPPVSLMDAFKTPKAYDLSIILYEKESENKLKDVLKDFKGNTINLFVGPEGGFTDKEIESARQHDIISVTLGNRILRTETAGLYALSNIIYESESRIKP